MTAIDLERSRPWRPEIAPPHAWPVLPRPGYESACEPGVATWWCWQGYELDGASVVEVSGSGARCRPRVEREGRWSGGASRAGVVRRVAECTSPEAAAAALRLLTREVSLMDEPKEYDR
jgi:hypothetical protein